MKILALLFVSFIAAAAPITVDDTLRMEIEFDKAWVPYLMAKIGCPLPDKVIKFITTDECLLTPVILADKKMEARRLAMKVFDLQERK